MTVERGKVRSSEVVQLKGNSTVYQLPVKADMAPNVYVSVVVVKGVDQDNPRPNFKIGMLRLKVKTSQQALNVTVKPDKATGRPGRAGELRGPYERWGRQAGQGRGVPGPLRPGDPLAERSQFPADPGFFLLTAQPEHQHRPGAHPEQRGYNALIADQLRPRGRGWVRGAGRAAGRMG